MPGNQLAEQFTELNALGNSQRAYDSLLGLAHSAFHLQRHFFALVGDPQQFAALVSRICLPLNPAFVLQAGND